MRFTGNPIRLAVWLLVAVLPYPLLDNAAVAQEVATDNVDSAERVISLADGSVYRGELLEYVPRSHVLLRLASGKSMRFDWRQIRRVAIVSNSPPSPPDAVQQEAPKPVPPPTIPPPGPPHESAGLSCILEEEVAARSAQRPARRNFVLSPELAAYKDQIACVSLRGDRRKIKLEFLADSLKVEGWMSWIIWPLELTAEKWRTACTAPCEVPLARKAIFRVVGRDMMNSDAFTSYYVVHHIM